MIASAIAGLRRRAGVALGEACPLGMEFASERLNAVQLARGRDGLRLRGAVSRLYPCDRASLLAAPRRFSSFVRETLAQAPFSTDRVVAAVPASELTLMQVDCQSEQGEPDAAAIARAARERLGADADKYVVDFLPVRGLDGAPGARSAIVAAAHRDALLGVLAGLEGAGLAPVALDISPAAVVRLVSALDVAKARPNVLVINFGRLRSHLTVVWGRRLMLDRDIDFAEDRLIQSLAIALEADTRFAARLLQTHGCAARPGADGVGSDVARTVARILYPEFESLARQIDRTLIYVASRAHGSSVERIYLMGGVARFPGMAEALGELVAVPVEVLDPLAPFRRDDAAAARAGAESPATLSVATGLALRGLGEDA